MPSSNKSKTFHTVTLVVAHESPAVNPLGLQGKLKLLLATHCECMGGMSTNRSCCHIIAACIALFNPRIFKTAKKKTARLTDVHRPDNHRPVSSGPPLSGRHRPTQLSPAPMPQRRTRDRRRNLKRTYLGNFTSSTTGSSQAQPATATHPPPPHPPPPPPHSTTAQTLPPQQHAQPAQSATGPQHAPGHISGLGILLNRANTCYAASVSQAFQAIDIQNNIDMTHLLPVQIAMAQELQRVCTARANPVTPAFDIVGLVRLVNDCLGVHNRFIIGSQECAGEFIFHILDNLEFTYNFFSIFYEEAVCPVCNGQYIQQAQGQDKNMLHVPPPAQLIGLLDLANLVQGAMAAPRFLTCLSGLACNGQQIQGSTRVQYGQNLIIWVNRNNGNMAKNMVSIAEPTDNDPLWGGNRCHVVLTHVGHNPVAGHWIAFIKRGSVWWKVDTDTQNPVQQNPFVRQFRSGAGAGANFTIDILIFSS